MRQKNKFVPQKGRYMKHKNKPMKLNWRMARLIILGWMLPLFLLSLGVQFFSSVKSEEQMKESIMESANKAYVSSVSNLNTVVSISRNASYLGTIRQSYLEYQEDKDDQKFLSSVRQFLDSQYRYNNLITEAIVYLKDEPDMATYTYSNISGATYMGIKEFYAKSFEKTKTISDELGTSIGFFGTDGHIYLVRNLVLSDYTPFAVIVMELNTSEIFGYINNILWYEEHAMYVSDTFVEGDKNLPGDRYSGNLFNKNECIYDEDDSCMYISMDIEGNVFNVVVGLNERKMDFEKRGIAIYFFIICALMVPLMYFIYNFFRKNIQAPVNSLVLASGEIENGNFGFTLDPYSESYEFSLLTETFNNMSVNLKDLFEKVYKEELALKDANISALQSQINPHFMNNTLEIINWQARMEGNETVSKMISALSVMLEATMDRKRERLVPLSVELEYVAAYIYIISVRFGKNFIYSEEIDESLKNVYVPRLIIQPIIENAVEHGGNREGVREVKLRIYQDEDSIYVEVCNNGEINEKDRELIDVLLGDEEVEGIRSHSLGIRNVNKRLKIIYGLQSGLTIKSLENGFVSSIIKIDKKSQQTTN